MKSKSYLIVLALFISTLIGCQSAVKSARKAGEGHFRARTLIEDKKASKSFIVNLTFNVQKGETVRLDATSPLNQHLASFLLTPNEFTYFIVPEKIYYKGKPQQNAFARFMAIPLEPSWLDNLLFRQPFEEKDWSCDLDKSGSVVSCLNTREKLNVEWSDNSERKMIIKLKHKAGEVQMNFHRIQPKVESGVSMTSLEIPKGFRRLR